MTYDPEFVEFIVQEVIRRLQEGRPPAGGVARPAASVPGRDLIVPERLVTTATLSGRLEGIGRVLVPRRCVVTPSVQDELRTRGIELRRDAPCESPR